VATSSGPNNSLRGQIEREVNDNDQFILKDLIRDRERLKPRTSDDIEFFRKSFRHLIAIEKLSKASTSAYSTAQEYANAPGRKQLMKREDLRKTLYKLLWQ